MKKIVGLFVMAVMMVMMAVSCTPNGAPLSLVGVWKSETTYEGSTPSSVNYVEFTDDDYIIHGSTKDALENSKKTRSTTGTKIFKATCSELYMKSANQTSDNTYVVYHYELAGNKLTVDFGYGVEIYTKD